MNRQRIQKIMILASVMAMTLFMMLLISGCGKQDSGEAENSEPQTVSEQEEGETIWGDESFGIDAKADEALKDYRNILLLGIDNGGRSDVLMILSINKNTNVVKSVTVLRDTYMQISPDGTYEIDGKQREFYKCNRAYKRDGIYGAMIELNRHMDLNIRECVTMDWACMAKFIDSMGGIEGYITDEGMLNAINKLIKGSPEGNRQLLESTGEHTLSGWQAVQYMRVRKYDNGGPQKRDEHNQDVLQQLFDKAKNMSLSELEGVYEGVASDIETNMSRNTLTETLALISQSTLEPQEGWPYEYTTLWQNDNSYYYFVCDTLESNVKEFHKVMFDQEDYEPSETVKTLNEKLETARKEQLH